MTITIDDRRILILALTAAIEAKFDASDWTKLAFEIDEEDTILEHHRLLRSLQWGDPDYGANIIGVLEKIGKRNFDKLLEIADFIELKEWLIFRHEKYYKALYDKEDIDIIKDSQLEANEEFD
jgi:hypothetical protein